MSETNPMPSQFLNKDGSVKMQDVAKIQISGDAEQKNISLNRATINGLVGAYGEESSDWTNRVLTIQTEKVRHEKRSWSNQLIHNHYSNEERERESNNQAADIP
jgi:hypothetical protein